MVTWLLVPSALAASTAMSRSAGPMAHTFSIVARHAATGEMGAMQSFVDPGYGLCGLELLRDVIHQVPAVAATR
jgi:hypothetical protein